MPNSLWWLACAPGAARFDLATRDPQKTQRAVLARILADNAETAYGRKFGFAGIRNVEDYQAHVPLTDYEDYLSYISRIAEGESCVLSKSSTICFEPTSGSSSASKLIPYNQTLRAEYQAGIAPWIFDMFRRIPGLLGGRAYWSISPAATQSTDAAGVVPVGFDDDTAYLNPSVQWLIRSTLAVPPEVSKLQDISTFRYVTLAFLLGARDLSLISVWNPTFLSLMLSALDADWTSLLIRDIANGTLLPPGGMPVEFSEAFRPHFCADRKRAAEIEAVVAGWQEGKARYDQLWPNLRLISCWDSASASVPAQRLREQFEGVCLAPKGLLATEGIVSIPYGRCDGHALALLSHFLEFLPEGEDELCQPAWCLDEGKYYSVVLTTGGGLYRYRLRDRVRVVGFLHECPLVEFVGKESMVSDHYGEKLNELHVAAILKNLGVGYPFMLLAPEGDDIVDHYTLFLADDSHLQETEIEHLRRGLESALQENTHYAYCRKLGQLKEVDVCWIDEEPQLVWARYFDRRRHYGQTEGNIKPQVLDASTGWRKILCCTP